MEKFFFFLMFLGFILAGVGFIAVIIDRKRIVSKYEEMDKKKEELIEIIKDAEVMIDELNKFSDYVITNIEKKNTEFKELLERYEVIAKSQPNNKKQEDVGQVDAIKDKSEIKKQDQVVEKIVETNLMPKEKSDNNNNGIIKNTVKNQAFQLENTKQKIKSGEKVVTLCKKYDEVMKLVSNGMSYEEIAKSLNIGKGEIQLIMQMNHK